MGETTGIAWAGSTLNFWTGCIKVSPGCKHCYMYRDKERYGMDPKQVIRTRPATFNAAAKWKDPRRVFVCSWSDFFIEQADPWRDDAWAAMAAAPWHTYMILTKRPENIPNRLPDTWGDGWPNVWLGVSVESQDYTHRIETLATVDAAVRFVSYEPALGPVNWEPYIANGYIDWLISGGESGRNPRPADLGWFLDARDVCEAYGVPFFHKQHGGTKHTDGAWGGYLLDGRAYQEFPG